MNSLLFMRPNAFRILLIVSLIAIALPVFNESTALAQNATTTPRAIISQDRIEVTEGSSNTYTVVLEEGVREWGTAEWGVAETVTVKVTKKDASSPDVTVGDEMSDTLTLTFTMSNWDTAQTVIVHAARDEDISDDEAKLIHTVTSGYGQTRVEPDVPVRVIDNTEADFDTTLTPPAGKTEKVIRIPISVAGEDKTVTVSVESVPNVEFEFFEESFRRLTEDISVNIAIPPSVPDVPPNYGIGSESAARFVVDIDVMGEVPIGGFRVCLPTPAPLLEEATGRKIVLLHYDGTMWNEVPSRRTDDGSKICSIVGVTEFSPYRLAFLKQTAKRRRELEMVLAGIGRTIASDAVEVLSGRFGGSAGSSPKVTVGGQMLRLTGGKEGEALKRVTDVAVGVAQMFGVTGGANGRTLEGTVDAATLSRHPGLSDGRIDRTNWRAPVRIRDVSVKDVLARSAFELPLSRTEDGEVAGMTLWGRGMASNFSGSPDTGFSMDGDLYSGYLGLDYRLDPKVMLGLAVSHTAGDVDYEVTRDSGKVGVGLDIQLTSVLPYAQWQPYSGLGVWGMFGAGWGEMDRSVVGFSEKETTDLTLVMGALGGRHALISWNGIDFAAKADAFRSTLRSKGKGDLLPSARGNAGRVRLLVEGRTEWIVSPVSRLQPRLEVGGRWDNGDAERGLGAEVGGGLAYTHTELGLGVEAQGRYLLAHEEKAFEDWGASLKVRVDPGIAGHGFWLSMAPVWGRPSTGSERLWGSAGAAAILDSSSDRIGRSSWAPGQLEMDFGYGLPVPNDGLVTPYGGLALGRSGAASYRFGSQLKLNTVLNLRVEGERENRAGGAVSHGVITRIDWQW